jgi:hypothetical protein
MFQEETTSHLVETMMRLNKSSPKYVQLAMQTIVAAITTVLNTTGVYEVKVRETEDGDEILRLKFEQLLTTSNYDYPALVLTYAVEENRPGQSREARAFHGTQIFPVFMVKEACATLFHRMLLAEEGYHPLAKKVCKEFNQHTDYDDDKVIDALGNYTKEFLKYNTSSWGRHLVLFKSPEAWDLLFNRIFDDESLFGTLHTENKSEDSYEFIVEFPSELYFNVYIKPLLESKVQWDVVDPHFADAMDQAAVEAQKEEDA